MNPKLSKLIVAFYIGAILFLLLALFVWSICKIIQSLVKRGENKAISKLQAQIRELLAFSKRQTECIAQAETHRLEMQGQYESLLKAKDKLLQEKSDLLKQQEKTMLEQQGYDSEKVNRFLEYTANVPPTETAQQPAIASPSMIFEPVEVTLKQEHAHPPKLMVTSFCTRGMREITNTDVTNKVYAAFLENGIPIYCWERECWKCGQTTKIYSYYLYKTASQMIDGYFKRTAFEVGVGYILSLDQLLSEKYSTIQFRYSSTIGEKYFANTCEHCGSTQGRNYVVDDPHEIMHELINESDDMDSYIVDVLDVENSKFCSADLSPYFDM